MKIESNLTVLISNYNHGKFINNLIQSILSQTLKPTQIIIIDDGSTDISHKQLQKYINNNLFKIILNFENRGVIFRMNQGLKLIKTKYFMTIGADDLIINENAFKISINYLNLYKKAGLSSALVYQLNNDYSLKKIIKTPVISNKARFFTPKATLKEIENYGPFINGTLTIVRTEYFKNLLVKYPLLEQLSDVCAFYCIAINHGVIFIPKALGGYRYQGNESYGSFKLENRVIDYRKMISMLKIINKKNYYKFDLTKFVKIFKLNAKLFYYKKKLLLKYNYKNNYYSDLLFYLKFLLYFISLDKYYFLRYIKYKIKYFFFNDKS